jgi:hypothetical protein
MDVTRGIPCVTGFQSFGETQVAMDVLKFLTEELASSCVRTTFLMEASYSDVDKS